MDMWIGRWWWTWLRDLKRMVGVDEGMEGGMRLDLGF